MPVIPETILDISAGNLPVQVVEACKICQAEPDALMAWAVKQDAVVIILPDGRKVTFPISGRWINLPFPWAVDSPPAADHMPKPGAFDYAEHYPQIQTPVLEPAPAKPRRKK